ncbi:MAG: amidase [Alphaproteobacteria bacterium]|nr:amidase [Alphaproteobacteria bacterium]
MDDPYNAFCDHAVVFVEGVSDGPLDGLTFAAKDLFDIADYRTGAGNPDWLMTHSPASRHAAVVETLLAAGATLVGKTHTDELSRGIFGENPHYGTPVNPKAENRLPGGSSSGSAVAVAASMVDFAIGTDTGGSVRAPASFCGLYGIRPTHGRLSLDGVVGQSPSFDTVGWFARDAELFARVGVVLLDAEFPDYLPECLIFATDAFAAADSDAAAALQPVAERLSVTVGASEWRPISPEGSPEGLAVWRGRQSTLQGREAWQMFADWIDQTNPRFGYEVSEIFHTGAGLSDRRVAEAKEAWPRIVAHLDAILAPGTFICLPTTPFVAPLRGQPRSATKALRGRIVALTCIAGLLGAAQITLPLGDVDGVPLGISLLGRRGSDEQLLGFARQLAANL